MGTFVFSGGDGTTGFSTVGWDASDIVGIVSSVFSSSHSGTQVTYISGTETFIARGTLGGYSVDGDPTSGTVTSFTYTTSRFGGVPMSVTGSGFSLSVATLYDYIFNGNALALHHFMFDGADTMTGSSGADVLEGYGSGDTINGGAGNDLLFGENYPGDDVLTSVAGNDLLGGGDGDDALFGQGGNDTLTGGAGMDWLAGGIGNDSLDGGADDDVAAYVDATAAVTVSLAVAGQQNTGGAGLDTLISIEGLEGSDFDDTLTGNSGANVILGGLGNDTLNGGDGIDTVSYAGASGAITIDLSVTTQQNTGADGLDTITDFENAVGGDFNDMLGGTNGDNVLNGRLGSDTVSYAAALAGVTVSLTLAGQQNTIGAGLDTLIGIESLIGTAFNDTLTGSTADNVLNGGDGDDFLAGGVGNDTLSGGAGVDTASFADVTGDVYVNLTLAFPQTVGGNTVTVSGIENVIGGAFNDVLTGDAANNVLTGAAGADTIDGGQGNDTLDGGDGVDTVTYGTALAGVVVSLVLSGQQNTVGSGLDTLSGFENATGSAFADSLIGTAGNNQLIGGDGNDVLEGGLGDDLLQGGAGLDIASYASATAGVSLFLSTTVGQNFGGQGADTWSSIEGLRGSAFNDFLWGDDQDNILQGGAGNDEMHGAGGNDIIDGGDGSDTVSYGGAFVGVEVSLAIVGSQQVANFGVDTLINIENVRGGAYNDVLYGNAGSNVLIGEGGDDILAGGGGNDVLFGGAGSDTASYSDATAGVTVSLAVSGPQNTGAAGTDNLMGIERLLGSAFNDVLSGGAANDTLTGGAGNDIIDGGALGNDTMDGGDGVDTISYASATAGVTVFLDRVTDFNTGGAGFDTVRNFENIVGSAFSDLIYSGANVAAGAGNDTLFITGAALVIDGGDGIDTLSLVEMTGDMVVSLAITGPQNVNSFWALNSPTFLNIENLVGGLGNETLTGNDGNNAISGGFNLDKLYGGGGDDTLDGGQHDDMLFGGQGADTLLGGLDNDRLDGGAGDDVFNGGDGVDIASFASATSGATVSLAVAGAQNTGDGNDTLIAIEGLSGSAFNDVLTGNAGDNFLSGGSGGDDVLDGGDGNDTVSYADAASGVSVSLAVTTPTPGEDVLISIESLIGSAFNDTLTGNDASNTIAGGAGDDVIDGGAGIDTASYDDVPFTSINGVTVDLSVSGPQNTGAAGMDTLIGIENLVGSWRNDTLTGDAGDNTIFGGRGADVLNGGDGNDRLDGGEDGNILNGDAGDDVLVAFPYVSSNASQQAHGGDGNDTVSFENVFWSVNFSLANTGSQYPGGAGGYIYVTGVENVLGGQGANNLTGDGVANILTGAGLQDTLSGAGGDDTLRGLAGNDQLNGGDGADVLDGGLGVDTMAGGDGNDTYVVDNAGDFTTETSPFGGIDTIQTSLTRTLGANFENLTLTGVSAITGYGNVLNNVIIGNSAANTIFGYDGNDILDGGAGADQMFGGLGDDIYYVDNAGDVASEASALGGTDIVYSSVNRQLTANIENLTLTGAAAIGYGNILGNVIVGNASANTLYGFEGNDRLDGGAGVDTMFGAAGNDTYVVDDVNDITVEGVAGPVGGIDTIETYVDRGLNANIENLTLLGSAAIGYGNVLDNVIVGTSAANSLFGFDGADTLNGGTGADQMFGGNGNDTYYVDNAGDVVSEASAAGGIDTVISSVARTLTAYVENLTLTGSNNITGAGNGLDNVLIGNIADNTLYGLDGADTLDGGLGSDTLQGGAGADTYAFTTALGVANVDTIFGFNVVDDTILLNNSVFTGLSVGALDAGAFVIGAAASDADDRIIYNSGTGQLFFDADGNGAGNAILFASLTPGLALTSADFIIGGP